jgi:N-acylneuraminate cytidylyltransferase
MNNLAIIPARGGSKRIPKKNIKSFLGSPIISYSIKAAIDSDLFDEVMVSTDDEDIAKIAKDHGASVPFLRSFDNANDFASTIDVIIEVINSYKIIGKNFNSICCIYPCAPFITQSILKESYHAMLLNDFDVVLPIVKYSNPIQRAFMINNERIEMYNSRYINTRSQDLQSFYFDAGQFYWFNPDKILKTNKLFTDNTGYVELDELNVQDIDNEIDWKIAELKFSLLKN